MRLSIRHRTSYAYSAPVFLEPHFLRLRPRSDPAQEVLDYSLEISPEPAGRSDGLDPEGNWLTCVWFGDRVEGLELTAAFEVETRRHNPFDFLLTGPAFSPPAPLYPEPLGEVLAPYLTASGCAAATELARSVASRESLVDFLCSLNQTLHERCQVVVREHGDPWTPERTLTEGQGACRDLAVVFLEACRNVGIAARFASGFQRGGGNDHRRFLHAWAEVYLPGAGWRGFDPTHGLAVADGHVCVAASRSPQGAAPVQGTFRGADGITSRMATEIRVEAA